MRLIDQVKPEVLDALAESKIDYSSSYRSIITSLSSADRYRQLSIDQVDQLITFLPRELHPNGRTDFYYGDYLLQEKYKL
tara:strand:- start:595 stop:834 length:240 start_codon:yes stop_codon:yes gene_type:complete